MSDGDKNPIADLRVLVVEDNPVNQHVTGKLIEKLGCSCVLAENGREALHKLEQESFDLILTDLMMPELDGMEATRLIRASDSSYANIPIIAFTANVLPSNEKACKEAGMNDFIEKPITFARMKSVLESWASKIRANQ